MRYVVRGLAILLDALESSDQLLEAGPSAGGHEADDVFEDEDLWKGLSDGLCDAVHYFAACVTLALAISGDGVGLARETRDIEVRVVLLESGLPLSDVASDTPETPRKFGTEVAVKNNREYRYPPPSQTSAASQDIRT